MAIDYSSDVGKVRALIPDVDENDAIFTDEQIGAYLAMSRGGHVLRAAALAIRAVANNTALLIKVLKTDDLQVDGAKTADSLGRRADALEKQADEEDASEGMDFFAVSNYDYSLENSWRLV